MLFLIKMNSSKMIFYTMMILSTFTAMNCNNWLTLWITLEINLFMFLPLMTKKKMKDQPMKYFIIQSVSSSMIMVTILMNSINQTNMNQSIMFMISMMLKMGLSPMHVWVPSIMNKMSWMNCFIMTSILKIPPMIMCSQMLSMNLTFMPMILSLLIGSMSGLNQTSMKKIMAYSSITNSTWMLMAFMLKKSTAITFMLIYSMMNFMIMKKLSKNNLIYINQMTNKPLQQKMNLIISMLSISGLPPTIGFFNKWMIIKETIKFSMFLPILMILTSTISMFFYLRMTSFYLLNASIFKKNMFMNKMNSFLMMNLLGFSMMFLIKSI